jgi:hypothetical protein
MRKNTKRGNCLLEAVPVKEANECITEKNVTYPRISTCNMHVPMQCTSNIQIFFYIIASYIIGWDETKKV